MTSPELVKRLKQEDAVLLQGDILSVAGIYIWPQQLPVPCPRSCNVCTRPVIGLDFRGHRCTRPPLLNARNRFAGYADCDCSIRGNPSGQPSHGLMCGGYWSRTFRETSGVWGWAFRLD